MRYSSETLKKIYNEDTGERIEIGPDADSLGVLEIRSFSEKNVMNARIVFDPNAIPFLIEALKSFEKDA